MVVGICSRNEDMTVNVCKKKQLTNMRAAGADDALRLTSPRQMSLEQCLEFLADDELLEVTPQSLRIRKRELDHAARMRQMMKQRNNQKKNKTNGTARRPLPFCMNSGVCHARCCTCKLVQTVVSMVCTNCVCSGAP